MARLGSSQYSLLMQYVNEYSLRDSPAQYVRGFTQIFNKAEDATTSPPTSSIDLNEISLKEKTEEERGNAQCVIGTIFADGVGVKQDLDRGIGYYHKASGINPNAMEVTTTTTTNEEAGGGQISITQSRDERRGRAESWQVMARGMIKDARQAGETEHLKLLLQVQKSNGHVIADCT